MQVFSSTPAAVYSGVAEAFSRISSTEGHMRLWRGVWSVILGAGPAHAVYFGTYEVVKETIGGNEAGHRPASAGELNMLFARLRRLFWGRSLSCVQA
jgi:solute carrier family 25 iron transporter 28/37